jgi:hypothetical protein
MMFIALTIFREPRSLAVSGAINNNSVGQINYGLRFAVPPKLAFTQRGSFFDFTVTEQTEIGFNVQVKNYKVGDSVDWVATGVPSPATDPRSVWERFDLGQQVSSISAIVTGIGLVADLLGIFKFLRSKMGS